MSHLTRIHSKSVGTRAVALPHDTTYWVNIALAIIALVLMVYYVAQANVVASRSWEMRVLQDRLAQIHQERDAVISRQGELDDRVALEQLARGSGLVPAGAVVYLFQDGSVAAR